MKRTAMGRISPTKLQEFDQEMLSWANRLCLQSQLRRVWLDWWARSKEFQVSPTTKSACEFVFDYLSTITTLDEFKELPVFSQRIICRTIARLEERISLLSGDNKNEKRRTNKRKHRS